MARWFDQLRVGMYLTYWGARWSPLRRRGLTLARVVALDAEHDVAHLQTYCYDSAEEPITHIFHLPAHRSSIERSIHALHGVRAPLPEPPTLLREWRERRECGEVTGFSDPLWRVREMIWETLLESNPEATPESVVVIHAFPKRSTCGAFSILEVNYGPRDLVTRPS